MHPYQRVVGDCFANGYRTQNLQGISARFVNKKSGQIYRIVYTYFFPTSFFWQHNSAHTVLKKGFSQICDVNCWIYIYEFPWCVCNNKIINAFFT